MILAESLIHTLNPFALELSDGFGIRWYGLAYLSGFLIAWLILRWMAASRRILLTPAQVTDFLTWLIIGVLVGGRVGYVLLYSPALLWSFDGSFPFWGALKIHEGGMASHGGMAGVIVASILYAHRLRITPWHLIDITAFIAPPGLGLGRVANFINGELWGRPLPEKYWNDPPWWSLKYPMEMVEPNFQYTDQVVLKSTILEGISPEVDRAQAMANAAYAGRADVIEAISPYLTPYYPSQLFQAASDGIILFLGMILIWLLPRKPGVLTGSFLIIYGILRFVTEQYRGQFTTGAGYSSIVVAGGLSVVMVILGISIVTYRSSKNISPIGGLLKPMNSA